jgi:hypothetical protein
MTCSPLSLLPLYDLDTAEQVVSYITAQRDADLRVRVCRDLCARLSLCAALTHVLVSRAASEHVVRAASNRFRAWEEAQYHVIDVFWRKRLPHPKLPTYGHAAAEIVQTCIELERVGLLERTVGGKR